MSRELDPAKDFDNFELWFQELPDDRFGCFACDWMESVKAGAIFATSGYDTFQGWVFDNKWPTERASREAAYLNDKADASHWSNAA